MNQEAVARAGDARARHTFSLVTAAAGVRDSLMTKEDFFNFTNSLINDESILEEMYEDIHASVSLISTLCAYCFVYLEAFAEISKIERAVILNQLYSFALDSDFEDVKNAIRFIENETLYKDTLISHTVYKDTFGILAEKALREDENCLRTIFALANIVVGFVEIEARLQDLSLADNIQRIGRVLMKRI